MKKMLAYTIVALLLCMGCSDPGDAPAKGTDVDRTTNFIAAEEKGGYDIHFKPPSGWFGDPIPYFAEGEFYLYYLHDWRNIYPAFLHPWHLATSPDAGTWTYRGEVLPVGRSDEQDAALCTGGIVLNRETGQYHMFYAGHRQNNSVYPAQAVLVALSSDLKEWTKDKSFYLAVSGPGYNRDDFRDPHVYWDDEAGLYRMLVTAQLNGQAAVAHYTSTDLYDWQMQDPFYTDPLARIYECVDVFREGAYWYMVYSDVADRKVHYKYSTSQHGPWTTPANDCLDGIAYYAGKTASDGDRRYIFGWCPTRIGDGEADQWGGSMVTHRIVQNPDGTLSVDIPGAQDKKLSTSRENPALGQTGSVSATGDTYSLGPNSAVQFPRIAAAMKITTTVTADAGSRFGFEFASCEGADESYRIFFDQASSSLAMYLTAEGGTEKQTEVHLHASDAGRYDITIVIEKSVAVVYVNGRTAFTNRMNRMYMNPWSIVTGDGAGAVFADLKVFN